jgi:type I restriction enzyme M protein
MIMTNNNDMKQQPRDIMQYESKIWEIADLMLSASIKQSDFPDYMMPFFALMMLEGRMLNAIKKVEEDEGITAKDDPEDFEEAFKELDCGYNEFIVMQGKTLSSICDNDTTFEQDFTTYLQEFDDVLKRLLGIDREKTEMKYLNMDGIAAELRAKGILMDVVTAWSKIDLSAYDNSAITTLEEHIKRKWADISASTAGEQYTPDDIISLIAEIVVSKLKKPKNEMVHIYDPTSGGANLLFGTEDRLAAQGYTKIATWGSEYNDKLYALAAIESRFRKNSTMHYGNTLTTVPYHGKKFDVIVANPPYGDKWSGFQKEIKNDQLGQFPGGLPAVSDGQLLFMQHILWQLDSEGIAVEVHNGSTLFSGNAGSGESNIRKYIFDKDWVEAIIQMPQNEFFNTGIYTYLWIMNKKKPLERKDKVALIDGSNLWQLLKKAKGDKRREMTAEHRKMIVDALTNFEPNDICKIFNREHFYYNCQSLTLTDLDEDGRSVVDTICKDGKVKVSEGEYRFDEDRNTMVRMSDGEAMGCGKFTIKPRKDRKTGKIVTDTYIEPVYINDYEIIPHHFNQYENQREIDAFMQKYVFKPYTLENNTVGVELNFNKEFYVPEVIESVEDVMAEIKALNGELLTIGL